MGLTFPGLLSQCFTYFVMHCMFCNVSLFERVRFKSDIFVVVVVVVDCFLLNITRSSIFNPCITTNLTLSQITVQGW